MCLGITCDKYYAIYKSKYQQISLKGTERPNLNVYGKCRLLVLVWLLKNWMPADLVYFNFLSIGKYLSKEKVKRVEEMMSLDLDKLERSMRESDAFYWVT